MKRWAALLFLVTVTTCRAQDSPTIEVQATTPPQATLTWTDPNSAEDGTAIERKCGTQTTFTEIGRVAANVTTYVAQLDPAMGGQTCTFQVAAYNAAGKSPYSNSASCVVPSQPLLAPTGLSAGTP